MTMQKHNTANHNEKSIPQLLQDFSKRRKLFIAHLETIDDETIISNRYIPRLHSYLCACRYGHTLRQSMTTPHSKLRKYWFIRVINHTIHKNHRIVNIIKPMSMKWLILNSLLIVVNRQRISNNFAKEIISRKLLIPKLVKSVYFEISDGFCCAVI